MKKFRELIYPFILSLGLIHLQSTFGIRLFPLQTLVSPGYPLILNALVSGIVFGLLACPGCALPITFSFVSSEISFKNVFYPAIVFNFSRLLSISIYAFIGNIGFSSLRTLFSAGKGFMFSGLIMLVFAVLIYKNISFKSGFKNMKIRYQGLLLYAFWGFSLGFGCGLEATGFLMPLWNYPQNIVTKIASSLIFAFFSVIPVLILIFTLALSLKKLIGLLGSAKVYLRNLASFYLFILGLIFILSGSRL